MKHQLIFSIIWMSFREKISGNQEKKLKKCPLLHKNNLISFRDLFIVFAKTFFLSWKFSPFLKNLLPFAKIHQVFVKISVFVSWKVNRACYVFRENLSFSWKYPFFVKISVFSWKYPFFFREKLTGNVMQHWALLWLFFSITR